MVLVLMWLRAHSVQTHVTFQTDWGQEFGGDNPNQIAQLASRFLHPLDADLRRYPLGRKGYNGRVERSHRTDDEEFYGPYLPKAKHTGDLLSLALHWVYFYNVTRPHFGKQMNREPPLEVLGTLGPNGPGSVAALPPTLLDEISTDLVLACDPETGNDLLARYILALFHHVSFASYSVAGGLPPWTLFSCSGADHRFRPEPAFLFELWLQNRVAEELGRHAWLAYVCQNGEVSVAYHQHRSKLAHASFYSP